ncbi:MAG: hypothetical protein IPM82_10860 [Saprospiraceae bacterium]|nr:hypothetical protein [Saprospiraceae bacterium]
MVTNEVTARPDKAGNKTSLEYEYKGVNYIGVIPLLAKAMQEQNQTIEIQAKKIETQQVEIDAIKTALAKSGIKLD